MEYNQKLTKKYSFTNLRAWDEAYMLTLQVYKLLESYPKAEKFSLVDQIKRSAISITSNIAEGYGRRSYKEKMRFYYIAKGSLQELLSQLLVSKGLNFINDEQIAVISDNIDLVSIQLQGLINKTAEKA